MNLTENERIFLENTVILGSILIFWLFIPNLGLASINYVEEQLEDYSMYQAESQERLEKQEYDNLQYMNNHIPHRVSKLENDVELLQKTMEKTVDMIQLLCQTSRYARDAPTGSSGDHTGDHTGVIIGEAVEPAAHRSL